MDQFSVLLVDDNATFLAVAARFLKLQPEVVVAATVLGGNEALTKVQELRPDVVLVDLAMPDLPGLEVISRLRAAIPKLAIIALTMMSPSGYKQAALAAGADDFVPKASMNTELLPAIRRVIQANQSKQGSNEKGQEKKGLDD